MNRVPRLGVTTFPTLVLAFALAGCGGASQSPPFDSSPNNTVPSSEPAYGRVWVTNSVGQQPAKLLAEFGGQAPVSAERNPVFGDCLGTTTETLSYQSAGTLSVSGASGSWQLVPDSTYTYQATPSVTWSPGTSLSFEASGGDVPAFTGTFVIPSALVFTRTMTELVDAIDGTADVVLSWSSISAENIWVGVSAGSAQVSCSFTGSAGSGTIPAAALATLPASGRTIRSTASNSTQLQLGNWWINLLAQSRGQTADGLLLE